MFLQNGPTPFIHPVTHVRIGPYEIYEGNAHQEHENIMVEEEQPKGKKKLQKEEG